MPVPAPRDPGATCDILTGWLGDPARLPGARITGQQTPEFTGFSSEILLVDVEHGGVTGPASRTRRCCSGGTPGSAT
jgi:hypothetical protein